MAQKFKIKTFFDTEGRPTGHEILVDSPNESDKPDTEITKDATSEFSAMFGDFTQLMLGYIEIFPIISGINESISIQVLAKGMDDFAVRHGSIVSDNESEKVYEISIEHLMACMRMAKSIQSAMEIAADLPRVLTAGIVSAYDNHISMLIEWFLLNRPNSCFSLDRKISIVEILASESIDGMKKTIVDEELFKITMSSHEDQINWIEEKYSVKDIAKNYANWPELMELFSRRNLFVHAGGKINDIYIKNAKKHKFYNENMATGIKLYAERDYFEKAVKNIFEFGVMLFQICWRKQFDSEKSKADERLQNLGYDLIIRSQYELAERVLKFALGLRGDRTEQMTRMMVVNLANALALQGRREESNQILSSKDWSMANDIFLISVHAVKGELSDVARMIDNIRKTAAMSIADFQEWPVFYQVRDSDEFKEAFKSAFGIKYVPSEKGYGSIESIMRLASRKKSSNKSKKEKEENIKISLPENHENIH